MFVGHDVTMAGDFKKMRGSEPSRSNAEASEAYGRLLDAVVWAVREYGYAGATMERIAARAGFTRGAIQHYFGNRRVDVIARVTSELLAERQAMYEARYGSDGGRETADNRSEMKAAFRDPRTWFLIEVWIASRSDPGLRNAIDMLQDRIERLSDTALEVSLGQFSRVPFSVLKAFLRSLTRGIALEYSRHSDAKLFDDVVDMAFDALEALDARLKR